MAIAFNLGNAVFRILLRENPSEGRRVFGTRKSKSTSGRMRESSRVSGAGAAEAGRKIYILNIPLIKVINDAFYVKRVQ